MSTLDSVPICFDKIYAYLLRKHGDKDFSINEQNDYKYNYQMLLCDWDEYHLAVIFYPTIREYNVWLENNYWIFGRQQTIGTKFWEKRNFKCEDDILDYIRPKMRKR